LSPINTDHLKDIENQLAASRTLEKYQFSSCSRTHIGLVRKKNEDALYIDEQQGLWLVADGMGGIKGGDLASAVVVDNLRSFKRLETLSESIRDIEARFRLANTACRVMFEKRVVGSTVAAILNFESIVVFLWAGDSRIYRWRGGSLSPITTDHNLAQERVRRGELSQDKAQLLSTANILTRAIGVHQNLRVDMDFATVEPDDRYLICTDGLYKDLTFSDIAKSLKSQTIELALEDLTDEALRKGAKDNLSAVIIEASSI
jgi:protein phosphatase